MRGPGSPEMEAGERESEREGEKESERERKSTLLIPETSGAWLVERPPQAADRSWS